VSDPKQVLELHDEGTWFYYVPNSQQVIGDGEPLVQAPRRGWWAAPQQVVTLVSRRSWSETVMWRLIEGIVASETYPATLTPVEHGKRAELDARIDTLYVGVTEQRTDDEPIGSPRVRLDGAPAPIGGPTWTATLPFELRYHPELLHLFPGHLAGFKTALAERLNDLPGVSAYDHEPFKAYVHVADPRPPRSRRKADQRKSLTIAVEFSRAVPAQVAGENRADAMVRWDAMLDAFVAEVDAVGAVVCPTCDGRGYHKQQPAAPREENQ